MGQAREQYLREKIQQRQRCCACTGLRVTLTGQGDDQITVESNPLFRPQAFAQWPGLVEQIEAVWKEDVIQLDAAGSDSDGEAASGSSSSSSSSSTSGDSSGAEAKSVAASESSKEAPPPQPNSSFSFCRCQKKGKIQAGVKMLCAFAKNRTAINHPKSLGWEACCL